MAQHEDPRRFKFVDETGLHLAFARRYGRAPGGPRVGQGVPLRVGTPVTLVGALTVNGREAVMSLDGALNAASFAVYLEQVLGPTLVPGDVVVPDKLPVHKVAGMAQLVEARGVRLLFLPPYSPDFAPIEQAWSKLKTALRTAQARTTRPWTVPWNKPWPGLPAKTHKTGLTIVATTYIVYETALAYNMDRGPINVFGLRVHAEL